EPLDQQSGFLIDRQAERTTHSCATAFAQPALCSSKQRRDHRRIILGGKQPEKSKVRLLDQPVYLRADAAHVAAATNGEEKLRFAMFEPRVLAGTQRLEPFL